MISKNDSYYSNIRFELVDLITKKGHIKVLEIGARFGDTLIYLKESGIAKEVDRNLSIWVKLISRS